MNPKHFVKGGILTKQKGGCSQVGLVSSPKPQDKRKWVQVVLGRFRWDFRILGNVSSPQGLSVEQGSAGVPIPEGIHGDMV